MDLSIRPVTPEMMEERGSKAFDDGHGVNDHGMNPGAPAIRDWQFGWHTRRVVRSRESEALATQQLEVSPP